MVVNYNIVGLTPQKVSKLTSVKKGTGFIKKNIYMVCIQCFKFKSLFTNFIKYLILMAIYDFCM